MGNTIKPLGFEVSISSADTCGNNVLIRVVNPSSSASVLNLASNTGTVYANLTVISTESLLVSKKTTDTVQGNGLLALPVAYRY